MSHDAGTVRGGAALAGLTGPLLLLLFAWPQTSSPGASPAILRETILLRVPVSADPAAISNLECTGRETPCAAGLGFLSPDDTFYFYDFAHDNVKVIAIRPDARVVRLLPGLGAPRSARVTPLAGIAESDGSIHLLVAAHRRSDPASLWTLEPGASRWRREPAAVAQVAGARLLSTALAEEGTAIGVTLGHDSSGNRFVERQESWHTQMLAKYGPDGRLLAEAVLPERPTWKPLAGWTDKWITSRGEVLEIHIEPRWMVVSTWKEGS